MTGRRDHGAEVGGAKRAVPEGGTGGGALAGRRELAVSGLRSDQ